MIDGRSTAYSAAWRTARSLKGGIWVFIQLPCGRPGSGMPRVVSLSLVRRLPRFWKGTRSMNWTSPASTAAVRVWGSFRYLKVSVSSLAGPAVPMTAGLPHVQSGFRARSISTPWVHLTNEKGPLPMGLRGASAPTDATYLASVMLVLVSARVMYIDGCGLLKVSVTV